MHGGVRKTAVSPHEDSYVVVCSADGCSRDAWSSYEDASGAVRGICIWFATHSIEVQSKYPPVALSWAIRRAQVA